MESFIKADVFFFVTTVAIVIVTVLLIVALYYFIRFARNIYLVSNDVKSEVDAVVKAVRTTRQFIEEKGGSAIRFVSRFIPTDTPPEKKKAKKKVTVKSNEE